MTTGQIRFGDLPCHGGWAQRCRKKNDRCYWNRWRSRGRRSGMWSRASVIWHNKLMAELLRQEPHQKGWDA